MPDGIYNDLAARDAAHVWHPFSHSSTEPELLQVGGAKGAWLELAGGRRILDGISSWWTCLHGHGHPDITKAIAAQCEQLDHVIFAGATHEPAVRLAEELLHIAPPGLSRVFYSDNGSTSVEVALKMAIQYYQLTGRPRRMILAFEGGYHGDTFGAMAVGERGLFTDPFADYLFSVIRLPVPRLGGDGVELEHCIRALEAAMQQNKEDVAAVILEPMVQGASGMRMHPAAFLKEVARICKDHGALFIADEVMTGFGRTGRLFACEHAAVSPDVLCLSKGLTGGVLPLSATLCREDLFDVFQKRERSRAFFHGHSFTANPIACAAALASLQLTRRPEFLQNVARIERGLRAGLMPLVAHPQVRDVRVLGLVGAVEFRETVGYLTKTSLAMRTTAAEMGVLLRPLGNILYTIPPACVTDAELSGILAAIQRLVADYDRLRVS